MRGENPGLNHAKRTIVHPRRECLGVSIRLAMVGLIPTMVPDVLGSYGCVEGSLEDQLMGVSGETGTMIEVALSCQFDRFPWESNAHRRTEKRSS